VVGSAFVARGLAAALLLYALGMGWCSPSSLALGLLNQFMLRAARSAGPYLAPVGAMLLLTGGYVVYYWLTQGGLLAAALRSVSG
jgi:hypothetical protein